MEPYQAYGHQSLESSIIHKEETSLALAWLKAYFLQILAGNKPA
jgi:hypothetical protein